MNKKFKYTLEPRYVLLFLSAILVVIIFLSYKFENFLSPIRQTGTSMLTPMQKGIIMVGDYIKDLSDNFEDVEALQKENENLKKEYADLESKYNALLDDSFELERLRTLFQLSKTYSEYDVVGANIIASDTTGFNSVFTIDKGSKDGLAVDMNVIADNGLVGIITKVGDNYATVRSIIDDNSNVSATILKTNDSCMVCGNLKLIDDGLLEVIDISLSSKIEEKYQVVTSSFSTKYLPNIRIGYITDVSVSSDGLTQYAHLAPVVDFAHLETVLVITTLKENLVIDEE